MKSTVKTLSIKKGTATFLFLFKRWSWIVLTIAALLQLIFFWSDENFFAILCVLIAWLLTTTFALSHKKLVKFTLSSLIILGFAITQFCLPLIFTLTEGKPIIFNMKFPREVFIHSILALSVILLAHHLYSNFPSKVQNVRIRAQNFLNKFGFYSAPSDSQMWIMGFVGLSSMFYLYFVTGSYVTENTESSTKLVQGFIFLTYAPFLLPVKKLYSNSIKRSNGLFGKLLAFTLLLLIISIGGNSRGLFMTALSTIGIAYFLGLLLGKFSSKLLNTKSIFIGIISFWLITGPLADVATAIVIVRGQRSDLSSKELIAQTVDAYENKEELNLYKDIATNNANSDWDESYFDNVFLSRFCNLKFNDANLEQANKIGGIDPMMYRYSIDRFWASMPQPVLSLLQVNIDKNKILSNSHGDYLFFRATGIENSLGGFRTGQFAGTGMASFGWWYLLLLGIGIIPVYFILDLFVILTRAKQEHSKVAYLSVAGLLSITSIFMFISLSSTSESVVNIYTYIVRSWPQIVVLYALAYFFSGKANILLRKV